MVVLGGDVDEKERAEWKVVGDAVARKAAIGFGNVTFRIEDGKFTGLVEIRETLKTDKEK